MKLNFCTLFNSNYLTRGLALYYSLEKNCADFHLYVFAFDDKCYSFLKEQKFKYMTVVTLKEFEDEELVRVKPSRSPAEYCWTCTASTILYSIQKFGLENCTYLDADMCFYADPAPLIREMGNNSVLITSHRYTQKYDQSLISGKYCVQFVCFKNTEEGMKVLRNWRNSCIEWCYARVEKGKFGDQKYLDEWQSEFSGVHELDHLGGGIAPWNVQQYEFINKENKIYGTEISSGKSFEVIFFHFHGLKFYDNNIVSLTDSLYDLSDNVKNLFYKPYIQELVTIKEGINNRNPSLIKDSSGPSPRTPMNAVVFIRYYLSGIKKSIRNIFGKDFKRQITNHYYFYTDNFK